MERESSTGLQIFLLEANEQQEGSGFRFLTSAKRGSRVANIWIISNSPDGTLEIYITYSVISLF